MTKKRIADLIKEEAEKSSKADQAPAKGQQDKATASATSSTPKSTTTKTASNTSGTAKKRTTKAATAKATTASLPTATTENSIALKKQITELEANLKKAQAQITGLQKDLETQQTRIFELKDELTASQKETTEKVQELNKATEELESAKAIIRDITTTEKEALVMAKEETAAKEALPGQIVHGADLATNRNTLSLRNRPTSYKAIPEYAIQRGESNSMLSDDDIGWVD